MAMNHRSWLVCAVAATLVLAGCDLFATPDARIERAAKHMSEGDYPTAVIELRNALEKAPKNTHGRLLLAEVSLQLGDVQSAEKELRRARNAGATPAEIAPLEARLQEMTGQWDALAKAMAAPIPGFDDAARLDYLAVAQLAKGNPTEALGTLDAALARKPAGDLALRVQTDHARALAANGKTDEAMREIDAVLTARPGYPSAATLKAALLIARGDVAGAEKVLAAVPVDDPTARVSASDRMSILVALTEAQLAQSKVKEAGESAGRLQKAAPGALMTPLMLGRVALAANDPAGAVTHFQRAVQRSPDSGLARFWLAMGYMRQGNTALAETELQRVLQSSPGNVEVRKLLAESQIRGGRAPAALESLQPLLAANTKDPGVYALVGQARMMQGDTNAAEATLEQGIVAAPDSAELKLTAAAGYLANGDRQRALELLAQVPDDQGGARKRRLQVLALAAGKDKAVARLEIEALANRNPKDAELQMLAGAWLATQGDYTAAETSLKKALALAPDDGRVMLGLSQLAAQRGDMAASKQWLEEWHKRDPKAAEATLRLARVAFAGGDTTGGLALVNQALATSPKSAGLEDAAGRVLLDAKQNDAALKHFQAASQLAPTDKTLLFNVARAQMALSKRDDARATLEKTLSLDPNWPPAIAALAQVDVADGKTDDALALAGRLKKALPNPAAGFALEGDIYMASRQFEKAADAYHAGYAARPSAQLAIGEYRARRAAGRKPFTEPLSAWLKANPGDSAVRSMLGEALQADGNDAGAIREYERVVAGAPDNVFALNNLAVLYQKAGDKRALETAKRAYEGAPTAPAIADTYGWILLQSGDNAGGLKLIRQAAENAKNVPEIQYHLGVALVRSGEKAEGRKTLEAAIAAAGNGTDWKAAAEKELAALK